MWFPLPQSSSDILLLEPNSAFDQELLFHIIASPEATERREKISAVTADGSGKHTARLLESGKWMFKSDTSQKARSFEKAAEPLRKLQELAKKHELWHPQKQWFVLHHDEEYWPVSICPKLTTLWYTNTPQEKWHWWGKMLQLAWHFSHQHQLGLDLNPSNFGFLPGEDQLYYIDDELYGAHTPLELGECVAARIPENDHFSREEWLGCGQSLQSDFLETFTRLDQWLAFFDGINSYPLTYKWESQRLAVNEGLTNGHPLLDPRERRKRRASLSQNQATTPKRTCIFSDVHANLYALESVLKEAKQLEVDSYLFLGDAVGYGPHPSECLERLMNLPNLQAIRGNHDQMVAEGQVDEDCNRLARASIEWSYQRLSSVQREWLLNLPLEVQNGSQDDELMWLAVHGAPIDRHRIYAYVYEMTYRNNLQHIEEQGVPLCFYGHTHVPFIYRRTLKTENGQPTPTDEKISPGPIQEPNNKQFMLFNPGSVGQPRDRDPRASFAIWDRREKLLSFQRIAYPIEKSVAALHKTELPEDLAIRLEMGW